MGTKETKQDAEVADSMKLKSEGASSFSHDGNDYMPDAKGVFTMPRAVAVIAMTEFGFKAA